MEILFHREKMLPPLQDADKHSPEVFNVYLKRLSFASEVDPNMLRQHHHTHFEIHAITEGEQCYEIGKETVSVKKGSFLLIPPAVSHRSSLFSTDTRKLALTFRADFATPPSLPYILSPTPRETQDLLVRIEKESRSVAPFVQEILYAEVFSLILYFLRFCVKETVKPKLNRGEKDLRVALAKSYIEDNLHTPVSVGELAAYTHLCRRQLERLFLEEEGMSVGAYVRARRTREIERLLSEGVLSLSAISEQMGFSNEYYFNAFFKKENGMTPGAYRRSILAAT